MQDTAQKAYQIIPRKYRPQTFANVVCQETIVITLKNALRLKKLAQAYLFCGSRGTGKTTLARVFAKSLNCAALSADQEPCNQCPSCLEIASGHSLDVLEIDGASNRGIDDIRQINETIGYAPAHGNYRIYIIDEVHMLTKEAFNALLKTLEEPPTNVKFFFATTEPHKVLPTIISRCQRFDLNRISAEGIQSKLSWIAEDLGVTFEAEALLLIAQMAEGSLRDAESLFDQVICYAENPITSDKVSSTLGLLPREVFFQLDQAISEQHLPFAFELADQIFASGKEMSFFLESLMEHYRTLLLLKFHQPLPSLSPSFKERYRLAAALYTEEHCLYILDYLIQAIQQQSRTPFKRLHLEMLLLHLIRSKWRSPLPALVRRLCALEETLKSSVPAENPPSISMPQEKTAAPVETPKVEKPPSISMPQEKTAAPVEMPKVEKPPSISMPQEQLPTPLAPPRIEKSANTSMPQEKTTAPASLEKQSRYETLLRFSAVELEGIVKSTKLGHKYG
jgi:DNA polymerase-3 subunit gamma/tau